ncbi:tyrosine-type recombinase/integrase [Corynebacterium cystitidis]|uniref:tyrosine-type recombinase/integrase n=1 Tax=Corynebacterium cystitidis TaxID=35757 RepID=UPI00211DCF92|nr:tyrosine-type recombinase/integrase [Corynebacterium cystitidis]
MKSDPYSEQEIRRLHHWALGEQTENRRQQAYLLLALTLGAGLRPGEVATITAADVHTDTRCTVVTPSGYRSALKRFTPVEHIWAGYITNVAEKIADKYGNAHWIFRPQRRTADSHTITTFTSRSANRNLAPDLRRARTTWIINQIERGVPETAVIEAAGLSDLQHYRQLLTKRRKVSARDVRDLLHGPHPDGLHVVPDLRAVQG